MKKILIFSLAYYPRFVSGAEAAIKEITDRIDPNDIEFHMITLRFDPRDLRYERVGNVHVHRVGIGPSKFAKMSFIPLSVLTARRLQKKHHFDALWALMTYMLFPVALLRLTQMKVPHIVTLQDGDPYDKVFNRWFIVPIAPLLDYGFRTASFVQVISSYLARWPRLRGYKGPIEIIFNGANPKDIQESYNHDEVESIKKKFNKKSEDIWLVNTARLEHQKGNDDTIRALKDLPQNIKLLLVGGGGDEAKLRALSVDLGLEDRVFFAGHVDRSQVTSYRKAGDIFVGPSRSEGLGNAFLSAMASRLPVIATQEGGLSEFVFDTEHNSNQLQTAWVVQKNNPQDIAGKVKEILSNKDKVTQVEEAARAMVLEKFNWDSIAKQMRERVFSKVLSS